MKGFIKFICVSTVLWIGSSFIFSCGERTGKPANLLPQDKMVAVLMDVYVTEQKVSRLGLNPDSAAEVFAIMEKKIFDKHQVNDSVFRQSLNYYTEQSTELEKIYAVVIDSLALQEQRLAPGTVNQ